MQPLKIIAIVGVATAALGTGFLQNSFVLTVQDLGVQEQDLVSPVKTVDIDLELLKVEVGMHGDLGGVGANSPQTHFHNTIDKCSFHTPTSLAQGTIIICKLTDDDNDVIAEGKSVVGSFGYSGSSGNFFVPITQTVFHFSNDVQEVHDVKIVVLGPKPTGFP